MFPAIVAQILRVGRKLPARHQENDRIREMEAAANQLLAVTTLDKLVRRSFRETTFAISGERPEGFDRVVTDIRKLESDDTAESISAATSALLAAATADDNLRMYVSSSLRMLIDSPPSLQSYWTAMSVYSRVEKFLPPDKRTEHFDDMLPGFLSATRGRLFRKRNADEIVYHAMSTSLAKKSAACQYVVGRFTSPTQLVNLLRDPHCVGEYQDAVMARLDELARPQPDLPVSLAGLGAPQLPAFAITGFDLAHDQYRHQTRLFRTVSDVAAWARTRHPEIDLDAPFEAPIRSR